MTNGTPSSEPTDDIPAELAALVRQIRHTLGSGGSAEQFQSLLTQLSAAQATLDGAATPR